jgi:Domain of unknown function (DUF3854)/Protein of unknown function (DUF3631)
MSAHSAARMLRSEHADHLAQFHIPSEMLEAVNIQSVTDSEARETLGMHGHRGANLAGILFPYLSPLTGARIGGRVRLDHPLLDGGGKYISEQDCRHLFFAPVPKEWLVDTTVPIVFAESEKAALALQAFAQRVGRKFVSIAIGGCWGWRRRSGKLPLPSGGSAPATGPSPDLDLLQWQERSAILAFDSNTSTNLVVRSARRAFAQELAGRRANVLIADVPSEPGVNGPDDLLAAAGDAAMLAVLGSARPFAECAVTEANQEIADLNADKKRDPLPAIKAVAAVADATRRTLLIGHLVALRIPGVTRRFIEQQVTQYRTEDETAHAAATEAAKRGRLAALKLDRASLIGELEIFFSTRVWHPSSSGGHSALIKALFVALTHCKDSFSGVPYLCLESATPGCGKSTVLDLFSFVVARPLYSAGLSRAVLVRQLDERQVTLLLDESEWLAGHSETAETIRGVLHAGYRKGATYQVCEGDDHTIREFKVFGPKVFSAINGLTGALLDRCIVLHLEKAPANVTLLPASADDVGPIAVILQEKLEAFALQVREELQTLAHQRPPGGYWPEFRNREAEIWHPLLTIAKACGQEIEKRALEAARVLTKAKQSIQADERRIAQARELVEVLGGMDSEIFRPADLVEHLETTEAWGEALSKKEGSRLKAAAIGRYLTSFRISSRDRQRSGSTYNRLETLEIIGRHVPILDPEKSAMSATDFTDPISKGGVTVAPVGQESDDLLSRTDLNEQWFRGTVAPVAPLAPAEGFDEEVIV